MVLAKARASARALEPAGGLTHSRRRAQPAPFRAVMFAGLPGTPLSVKTAPALSSCGVKERSDPSIMLAAAGSGPNSRNSPTQTGVAPLSHTSIWAYRPLRPGGVPLPELAPRGTYIGLPASRAMLRAVGSACQLPGAVASE